MAEHGSRRASGCSASPSTGPGTATTARPGAESSWSPTTRRTTRLAHLAYVALPGGDAGVRNPCRMALSHLRAAGLAWDDRLPERSAPATTTSWGCSRGSSRPACGCVPTSSMGRLFDAVASLAGVCHRAGTTRRPRWSWRPAAAWGDAPGYGFGLGDRGADPGTGDRGGRGGRRCRQPSRGGRRPVPPGGRRPGRRRGRRLREARPADRGRDAQRRRVPQRVPHLACGDPLLADAASRCSATAGCRPATPASPSARSRCWPTVPAQRHHRQAARTPEEESACV